MGDDVCTGDARAVGWNWMNSISVKDAPVQAARARPSPVLSGDWLYVAINIHIPPVAKTTADVDTECQPSRSLYNTIAETD